MKKIVLLVCALAVLGCNNEPASSAAAEPASPEPTAAPAAPAAPAPIVEAITAGGPSTVVSIAAASPDHTTLVTALKAADLVGSLASPGGVYTVFAPTNAAFAKLPAGTVEGLLAPDKIPTLKNILQHHATVPILQLSSLKDGQTLGMADGTKVTVHVQDGKVMIDDANIIATVSAANGIVHVIDSVLLPKAK